MAIDKVADESGSTVVEKTVSELAPRMSEVNITVKVMSKSDIHEVSSRFDSSILKVSDALVGDSTGAIIMTLWNDDIDKVNKNETISIKNGKTSLFRGSMRLKVGKHTNIEPAERTITEVNEENNLSDQTPHGGGGAVRQFGRIMRSKTGDGRGPPRRPWHSHYDKQLFAYVIGISQKHGVNPDRFLKKIAEARENKESTCKTLTIQCRGRTKDHSIYRITKKDSLVAQSRIPNYFLEDDFKDTVIFSLSIR